MNAKTNIFLGIITVLMVILFALIGIPERNTIPKNVYQVYLNGEKIGLVENRDELLNLINEEQQDIKDMYHVDQVYPPDGFEILEYVTYDERVASANNIYQRIKDDSDFTIEGYQVTIKTPSTEEGEEGTEKVIYVLDEQVYRDAEYNFVTTFVDEADYQAYITNSQEEIKTVGSVIKHMEFGETISIKRAYIPVREKIFTDVSELTQYLLYGTTDTTSSYIVQQGDTLASVAEASKLNVRELLIANPQYKSETSVLAIGDRIANSLIDPILTLYQEMRVTEDVEQAYTKRSVVDNSMSYNSSRVTQTGVTGLERITQELRVINGERSQETTLISSVTIRASIDEITSVGPSYNPTNSWTGSGGTGGVISTGLNWSWPTNTPYVITTNYEYRWGSFHNALDISGTGFGSPIYAARAGEVVETYASCANHGYLGSACGGSYGNYIIVRHDNNYYTMYAHVTNNLLVSVGSQVSQGQVIGYMGNSGSSTGTHLHFGFAIGWPHHGGTWYSPWSLYR